jgi:DNA-3-methyladenine glycosylase II
VTPRYWGQAAAHLIACDPVMALIIQTAPRARLRRRSDPFTALARSIVGQQISVKAAASVWDRLRAGIPHFSPTSVAGQDLDALRGLGLSRQKAVYLQSLAQHFQEGRLQPARWVRMADDDVIAELTEVKGIGRWTAEMFLIFHLQRPDVLPVADLGLQRAVSLHYNRGRKVSERHLRRVARAWSPWRTVATWYLWRSLDPIPVEY